jgi:hypothetical protein
MDHKRKKEKGETHRSAWKLLLTLAGNVGEGPFDRGSTDVPRRAARLGARRYTRAASRAKYGEVSDGDGYRSLSREIGNRDLQILTEKLANLPLSY